jgi:hypothetical protein
MTMKTTSGSPCLRTCLSRRHFLKAAAGTGLLLPLQARAAPDQVHDLRGRVTINNRPATRKSDILPGDRIVTGNDGHFVFVMGQDAMMLRSRSELVIERHEDSGGLLRLLTGAMGAVFGALSTFRLPRKPATGNWLNPSATSPTSSRRAPRMARACVRRLSRRTRTRRWISSKSASAADRHLSFPARSVQRK